jgi:hypothetical protein
MANLLYANNAAGTLSAGITNVATSLTLVSPPTAFPTPVPPQVFYVTLTDAATQTLIEIVKVTAVAGNVFSIVRAQDGTSALSWNAGDIVSERTIALELRGFENAAEGLFAAQNVPITPSTTLGIVGTTLGDNANAGSVGEYLTTTSATTPILNGVPQTVGQINLSAGDWDVIATTQFLFSGPTTLLSLTVSLSPNNGSVNTAIGSTTVIEGTLAPAQQNIPSPLLRVNVATPTVYFCVIQAAFGGGGTASGTTVIGARRAR